MSIVKAIYAVKPRYFHSIDNYNTRAIIKYCGHNYMGRADVHPDDIDFTSTIVGRNIALSRARIAAMKAELKREKNEYDIKSKFFIQAEPMAESELRTIKLIKRAQLRCKNLRTAIKWEEDNLNKYLQGQAKAIESVKKFRAKQDTSN